MSLSSPTPLPPPPARSMLLAEANIPDRTALFDCVRGLCDHRLHALTWMESLGGAPDLLYARCCYDVAPELHGLLRARLPALRRTLRRYQRIRSGVSDPHRAPSCVVVTRIATRDAAQAHDRADAAFAALQDGPHALRGLIAAHLYLSDDGRTLLECTAWHSADAQRRALQREPERLPLAADRAARVGRFRPRALVLPGNQASPIRIHA
ncbi:MULTISPECIES: hypothetical protein [Xanthomonas]|uniref:hypothetical protein n=1 Tax=Xanthomonas TaxID=338 RepID=UPI001FD2FCF3|nr:MULTISPECIES: hypothetical protein [unclassified Xanthomonas]WNH45657.1 hypothetical protein PG878_04090 [Xanthomonas sp. A6251]